MEIRRVEYLYVCARVCVVCVCMCACVFKCSHTVTYAKHNNKKVWGISVVPESKALLPILKTPSVRIRDGALETTSGGRSGFRHLCTHIVCLHCGCRLCGRKWLSLRRGGQGEEAVQ